MGEVDLPFTCNFLHDSNNDQESDSDLLDGFAATYRLGNSLELPSHTNLISRFVAHELDLKKLHDIQGYLWLAGLPLPPRALHHQVLLGREILITEQMHMHLLWSRGRILLKPIPRFLLSPLFWEQHLLPPQEAQGRDGSIQCSLRETALGFLLSYAALIAHESDFHLAKSKSLIPSSVTWTQWRLFIRQLLTNSSKDNTPPSQVAVRFRYGELRLDRIKLILTLLPTMSDSGFLPRYSSYIQFICENLEYIAAGTVYVVVILSAMQVGLAVPQLANNSTFQACSYGFVVFAILGPLAAIALVLIIWAVVLIWNWARTSALDKALLGQGRFAGDR
jgi:hypothetical protein